jgi:actin-like ATPase involved in cell morphogenesis
MLIKYHIDIGTGDILVLIVSDVRVNSHRSVVRCLRASGPATVLACRGRNLLYFSCQTDISVDVCRPVIDICGGVQSFKSLLTSMFHYKKAILHAKCFLFAVSNNTY